MPIRKVQRRETSLLHYSTAHTRQCLELASLLADLIFVKLLVSGTETVQFLDVTYY